MEQLIFVGIILLFSVLEAVARKGRARQGGGEEIPLPPEPRPRRPPPRPSPRPSQPTGTVPHSYDEDPSFDETVRGDETRMRPEPAAERAAPLEGAKPLQPPAEDPGRSRAGSEGLIPAEVWDEIQRMARGEGPGERQPPVESRPAGWPKPASSRPRPSKKARPSERAGAPTAQRRSAKGLGRAPAAALDAAPETEGTADHAVHLAHAGYGTSPAARGGTRPAATPAGAPGPAEAIRRLLTRQPGSLSSLRQAVVLQEVLGPPPGLRD